MTVVPITLPPPHPILILPRLPQDWTQGRPKCAKIFALSPEYSKDCTCVLACGPAPMVKDVESTAAAKELDFHKEIFAF